MTYPPQDDAEDGSGAQPPWRAPQQPGPAPSAPQPAPGSQYGQYGRPPYGPPPGQAPTYRPPTYGTPPPAPWHQGYGRQGSQPQPYAPYGQPPPGQFPYGPPPGGPQPRRKPRAALIAAIGGVLVVLVVGGIVVAFALRSEVLDPRAVERDVAAQFEEREGVAIELDCADDMGVDTGATYECTGVTADDEEVTLTITITDKEQAAYTWQTEP